MASKKRVCRSAEKQFEAIRAFTYGKTRLKGVFVLYCLEKRKKLQIDLKIACRKKEMCKNDHILERDSIAKLELRKPPIWRKRKHGNHIKKRAILGHYRMVKGNTI